ncbi:MAG: hypothetical protein ACD_3C00106G0011 [uncultured bacterium (gcode 4)]|uniref:Uncharacterized protein n=1 Tax=uncultured bacterium (gcode 4) TaxID=1234023 RepID=K2G1G3_9BACT|nr:MAG: hypothetical protein ACD_3C00106G0011 [uncultured bacterium (gcode 4)]
MKKMLYFIVSFLTMLTSKAFAEWDNITWLTNEKLKKWDISFSDIPKAIQSATSFILWFAATIAMIMIIVGALKYSLGSVEWSSPNKQKATDTIKYWIMWFIVSVSSWFIVNLFISNL